MAKEFVAELGKAGLLSIGDLLKFTIDVPDALRQLSNGKANVALQSFYAWNHRWVVNLAERNRRMARESYDFIELMMKDAVFIVSQYEFLESKRRELDLSGEDILDLGVHRSASTHTGASAPREANSRLRLV